jgi:hypothetical protein
MTLTAASFWLIGCSNSDFAGSAGNSSNKGTCAPGTKNCNPRPGPPGQDGPGGVQQSQAVLAVRDISCAFCHAQVTSNVITDFSAGTDESTSEHTYRKLMYQLEYTPAPTDIMGNPQPLIGGNLIVPKVDIPMTTKTSDCGYSNDVAAKSEAKQKRSLTESLIKCAQPKFKWGASSEKVVVKNKVSINPVSKPEDIKAIVGASKLSASGMALVDDSKLTGITGSSQSGFTANNNVTCEGAVVFDGPVLLKDALITTENGCRIYSTASIFVFGNTKVLEDSSANANLQLMSPIFIGIDISLDDIKKRLLYTVNSQVRVSRGSGSELVSLISSDASKLNITSQAGASTAAYARFAAAAPVVYSRHGGNFSGAIVAEHFIGRIGKLSFTFDPVFKEGATALFPEIKRALVVTE